MANSVFFGGITVQIVYYLSHHPGADEKIKAERQWAGAGGVAANAAVAFAAFGNQSTLVTGLGRHRMARVAHKDLADYQVTLLDCTSQPQRKPVLATFMVDLSSGERRLVYANTDSRKLRQDAINISILEEADILMLDGFYLPQAIQMAQWARWLQIPVVLGGISWQEGEELLLPLVDYALCASEYHPPGCVDSTDVIARLSSYGIENIAITGKGDPIIVHFHGETAELPVLATKPVDTLGAGAIFQGAFCHYILNNSFLLSLTRAAEIASQSCTSLGTRAWIEQGKFV